MTLWVVLPVKPLTKGKSRLHASLNTEEICLLNRSLFEETYQKLQACPEIDHILVVSQDDQVLEYARQSGGLALIENQQSSLNAAVSQALDFIVKNDPGMVLIVPTDLPWMTVEDLADLIEKREVGPFMVIVPDQRQWGTNAILLSHPTLLTPRFGRRSFQKHVKQAVSRSMALTVWLNKNIQRDLDNPQDLLFYNKMNCKPINIQTE